MISTNALSVFILHHHLNGLGNKNLHSIQKIMRASKPSAKKYKKVCEDFPDFAILTKSATPVEVQLTFVHTAVGNKSLGEYVLAFSLLGDIISPSVVYLNIDISFDADVNKIRLPIAEVLLCTAAGNLARSKKQRDWTLRNPTPLPPFITEAAIINGESDVGKHLKIFARSITEWAKEEETASREDDNNNEDSKVRVEAEGEKTTKTGKANNSTVETLTNIVDDCSDV